MKRIFILFILLIIASSAHATINCGTVPIVGLTIQGDRDNNHPLENTVSIVLAGVGSCSGIVRAFMKNDNPAYSSILSTLLSVQARGGTVKVVVSSAQTYSDGAKVIEYLEFP